VVNLLAHDAVEGGTDLTGGMRGVDGEGGGGALGEGGGGEEEQSGKGEAHGESVRVEITFTGRRPK
jgi:hypothetical protein